METGDARVWLLLLDQLLQLSDLADLLEGKDLILLVAIDGETGGVVAAVFEAGETVDESWSQKESPVSHAPVCPRTLHP